VVGAGVGIVFYNRSKPVQYRPDEKPDDITSELARALPPDAPKPKLVDVTRAVGLAEFRNFTGSRTSQIPEDMGPGLAWGDFDNDGDDDLFLVSAGGSLNLPAGQLVPCALYENLGNGTFRRVETFPDLRIHGMGAAWGDYDGDGFLDLVVTGYNTLVLFHNDGGKKFTRDPRLPDAPGFWSSATWGDYDNDRRLDLYVCGYVLYNSSEVDREKGSTQLGNFVPFTLNPSSFTPGKNLLFHQKPDGTFQDVAAGLKVQNPEGRSLGGLWHDFDNDGWLDLYVANDVSDNVFYHNTGNGHFEDISHPALVADYRSAMGLAVGDYDRDGDDDMHVTHWIAQENALYDNTWAQFNSGKTNPPSANSAQNSARPSANKYPLRFFDIADQKGLGQIALPFVGWGTEFVDLDQDGWLDLLVANGSTIEEDGPYPKKLKPQEAFVFWNRRSELFHNLAPLNAALSEKHVSRGLACADYDGDGDMDFILADLGEGVRLFRNDMAVGNWLKVRLRSKNAAGAANGFGDGSTVIAWVNGVPLRRTVGSVSYLSQSSHTLHWGLGPATRVDKLEVRWHAGGTNVFGNIEAGAFYEVTEDGASPKKLPSRGSQAVATVTPQAAEASIGSGTPASASVADEKQRLVRFWSVQRDGMNAMKVEKDNAKAIRLFREAIELNPVHEDSRYYLGLCLAGAGDAPGALAALEGLQKLNAQSHRAWQQWGVVRAIHAKNGDDLAAAEAALQRAHSLNPEETGALLVLGEVALMRGDRDLAAERLAAATRTNPKAVGGFFLRGYLAWKAGDAAGAKVLLEQARAALGPDWQPRGTTSEGDVKKKQHVENSPLTRFWENWNGALTPSETFAALDRDLASTGR
jgi:tetratricopeptide (TPR) repeat protein